MLGLSSRSYKGLKKELNEPVMKAKLKTRQKKRSDKEDIDNFMKYMENILL